MPSHEPKRPPTPSTLGTRPFPIIGVACGIIISAVSAFFATEYTAWALHWNTWLGPSIVWRIYHPLRLFAWVWTAYRPDVSQHVTHFANDALLRGLAIFTVGSLLGIVTAALLSQPRRRRTNAVLDSAHFATPQEVRRSPLFRAKAGPIIGAYPIKKHEWVPLRYAGELGVSYTESPGGGKTSGFLKTNLLIPLQHQDASRWSEEQRRCHTYGEEPSLVLLDIRGDLHAGTSGYQSDVLGKDVLRLEPLGQSTGLASYNPLWTIRIGSEHEYDDCYAKTLSIIDSLGKGLQSYWDRAALSFGAACIGKLGYSALNTGKSETFSLPGLAAYVTNFGSIDDLIADILETDDDPHAVFGWEDKEGKALSVRPWIAAAARAMASKASEEKSGVYGSFVEFLTLYRSDVIRENISTSTFSFRDIADGDKPVALYLTVPPMRLEDLRPYLRMVIDDGLRELTSEGGLLGGRSIRPHKRSVIFGLDETAALRYLDRIEHSSGFLRGYGVLLWLIWQSRAQQHRHYTENEMLSETMGVLLFGAPKSLEASKSLSDMLGNESIEIRQESRSGKRFATILDHKQEQLHLTARPLLTPFEVRDIAPDHLIAFTGGLSLYLRKFFYFRDPSLTKRAERKPTTSSAHILREIPFHAAVRSGIGPEKFQIILDRAEERREKEAHLSSIMEAVNA